MIKTNRLYIIPLTYNQLIKYIRNDNSLENELNVKENKRIIPDELKEALEQDILPRAATDLNNSLFITLWTIISREQNCMIGDFCFTGPPDEAGEVEIGYGIYDEFQGQGFMTETVAGIIVWLKKQNGIKSLIAHTETDNVSSYKVLRKNNFDKVKETDGLCLWKLNI